MNRYSWVCFGGAHPHIQPGSSPQCGASSKGDEFGGEAGRVGGKRGSSAGREGACVHHTLPEPPSYLGSGITSPRLQREKPSRITPFFPTGAPRAGPGSVPRVARRGGSPPRPPATPKGTKRMRGCPKHGSGSPGRAAGPLQWGLAGAMGVSVQCFELHPPTPPK